MEKKPLEKMPNEQFQKNNIHTFTMDGFLEFQGQGMGAELELETQRHSRCVFH